MIDNEQLIYKLIDQLDEAYEIKELIKFLYKNKIEWDKKKNDWSKPFYMVTKQIWVNDEKNEYKDKNGKIKYGYYETKFIKWRLGHDTTTFPQCALCKRPLTGKQERFCSDNCRILHKYTRDEFYERGFPLGTILWIFEKRTDDGKLLFPDKKDFTIIYPSGRREPFTKKKGKPKKLILENDFKQLNKSLT